MFEREEKNSVFTAHFLKIVAIKEFEFSIIFKCLRLIIVLKSEIRK